MNKMFAAQYCVTPTKRPGMRLPDRAATFLRDVRRRSLRVKRSKSLVINPKNEKRKSGKKTNLTIYNNAKEIFHYSTLNIQSKNILLWFLLLIAHIKRS